MLDSFLLSSYDYFLPSELIANEPAQPKTSAKLLVYHRQTGEIAHHKISDLIDILPKCSIIFNDTKVVKARIFGRKSSGGKIELLLNQPLGKNRFSCYIKGKICVGTSLFFDDDLSAKVVELLDDGARIVEFSKSGDGVSANELFSILDKIGHTPLPPYIRRSDNKKDESWYQSVFAKNSGAVAAPTASLHFDEPLLNALKSRHNHAFITLHVGAGTFKGVESEDIRAHKMHSEYFAISNEARNIIDSSDMILGVGTTVTRTIENYARNKELSGACELFLHPQNPPIRQNYLLTNFHLPKSTLIMLVASFIGLENTLKIYELAIKEKYRFYSYGDAMLVL